MLFDNRKGEPLSLGDAIRRGCEILPTQSHNGWLGEDGSGCALAAAAAGAGIAFDDRYAPKLAVPYNGLQLRFHYDCVIENYIVALNDGGKYTREQIADWCDANSIGVPVKADAAR